jgi:hypothetical protein
MIQWEESRTAKDYMPSEWRRKAAEKPKRQTKAERLAGIEAWRVYLKRAAALTK